MVHAGVFLLLVTTQIGFLSIECADESYDDDLQSSNSISRDWGISDTSTCVGKLFQYKIPPEKDAFKGIIEYYDVEGEKESAIPQWMVFDRKRSMLEGVPTVDDIGDTRISVKAYDNKGKFVSDVFVVDVYPLEERNTNDRRSCEKGEEIMMIAVTIDMHINNISSSQRISAISSLSHYLNIHANTLLLLPQTSTVDLANTSPFFHGGMKVDDEETNCTVITWQIGCNEKIWAEQVRVMRLVEKSTNDNTLVGVVQLPVIRWRLLSNVNPFRTRRQASNGTAESPELDELDSENDEFDLDEDDEQEGDPGDKVSPMRTNNNTVIKNFSNHETEVQVDSVNVLQPSEFGGGDEESGTEIPEDNIFNLSNKTASLAPPLEDEIIDLSNNATSTTPTESSASAPKATTETVTRNPPRVTKNLETYTIFAGTPYRKPIPEDIFDDDDGNTRNLSLKLIKPESCSLSSWIELDSENQTLLMIASEDAISNHEFSLTATNSANLSTNTKVVVAVQYAQKTRQFNFEISLHMKFKQNQNLTASLQFELLKLLAELYGDANEDNIQVRHVTCDPFVFTWTNNSLPLDKCDNSTIFKLLNVLTDEEGSMNVNHKVHAVIGPLLTVEKVTWKSIGLCEGVVPAARPPQPPKQNYSPISRNHIDNLNARVGELLMFRIPEDTFYDPDIANTRDLKLALTTYDSTAVLPENWLQFDEKNREIYGLPMHGDIGSTKYNLVCHDNANDDKVQNALQTIEVVVEPAARKPYNVEFSMTLNSSFEDFNKMPSLKRTFVEKLSTLFGDKNTSSVVVSGYALGSLIVIWHNKSLPIDKCPEGQIEILRKVLLKDNKELNDQVNKVMAPEFLAVSALVSPIGVCEGGLTELHATEMNQPSQEIYATIFNANVSHYIRLYFVDIILPVVIIVIMLLFSGIVACVLYRRQRRAKWALGNEDERRSFRNRGIPVIFQNELEERLETSNKSPIIMKVEKPPQPPPEYQKTPPMATTALLSDFDDPNYQPESGSYSTRSTERNGRGKGTPTYRKPPPYIPP